MNSNFTFLPPAFKDFAEASHKAEERIMGDPRAVLFPRPLRVGSRRPLALPLRYQPADAV